ncbi:MAG: hypothetical protein KA144_02195 [Xanthomonadaceae bacterium]|nr:hypothetical protein [Xanthomonadaceae bacterium]MBP7622446.1 hypothetical protein [Xanthomonadales bacterium]
MQTAGVMLLTNEAVDSGSFLWPGGKGVFSVVATFGGGSVGLEYLGPDGATWIAPTGGLLIANGGIVFELPPGQIRATVDTATAVYATATRIPE